MTSATQAPSGSWTTVSSRYEKMNAQDGRKELDRVWEALTDIKETIVQQVENNNLRPIDAVKSIACLTGSVFGYEEFHPRSGQMYSATEKGGLSQTH